MSTIDSAQLGTLKQNEKFKELWMSDPKSVPLVEQDLPFLFMDFDPEKDETFIKEADKAISNFMQLNSFYKLQIAQNVFENFVEYCSYISEDEIPANMKGAQPLSIWNHVLPSRVFVGRRAKNDKDIYIVLACECEWEKEHGLQLVFRQGKKLTRVSDQDGHLTDSDAFGFTDSEDELYSAF